MNKKILSVLLSLVMVMTLITGCGKKDSTFFRGVKEDSTFFKEVKEISNISTGESTFEMNIIGDMENISVPEQLLNADGKISVGIKMNVKRESKYKSSINLALKIGTVPDYKNVTTIAMDASKIYVDVASLVEFIKTINENAADELQSMLSQIGVTDSFSIDYKQLAKGVGAEIPNKQALDEDTSAKINGILDTIENDFKELQGKDGDDYTLSVNEDNAEQAVDALILFFENDCEKIIEIGEDAVKELYGEDSSCVQDYEKEIEIPSIKDVAKEIKNDKEEIIKEIKDSNINIVTRAKITGDKGNREGKISMETGEISDKKDSIKVEFNFTVKEGETLVEDAIFEDAADITTLVITIINTNMKEGLYKEKSMKEEDDLTAIQSIPVEDIDEDVEVLTEMPEIQMENIKDEEIE